MSLSPFFGLLWMNNGGLERPDYIARTKTWLSTVIIELGLCPFAKREFEAGRIHYDVIETGDLQAQLEHIIMECAALDRDAARETSLLIFPNGLSDFHDYLDLLALANSLIAKQGYEGIYQLASFHPEYLFAGVAADDPSHYTNRSPYPTVHILRESSVENALSTYSEPEKIPERNIKLTRNLGLAAMRALLTDCYR